MLFRSLHLDFGCFGSFLEAGNLLVLFLKPSGKFLFLRDNGLCLLFVVGIVLLALVPKLHVMLRILFELGVEPSAFLKLPRHPELLPGNVCSCKDRHT